MHDSAFAFVRDTLGKIPSRRSVLEIGSYNVNGSVRSLFDPECRYHGIDVRSGPGVDEVVSGQDYVLRAGQWFDTVVTTEVLEHTPDGEALCRNAYQVLSHGGVFLVTAATDPRTPHGVGGGGVGDEFYRNVSRALLRQWLAPFGFAMIDIQGGDIYAMAVKFPL